jgi:hypothetical protein
MTDSFNYDDFNTLISNATDAILCNSECQQNRQADSLYQTYLSAKTNLASAPATLQSAEQQFITFTQGAPAYTQELNSQLSAKADAAIATFQSTIQADKKEITNYIETYDGIFLNFKNVIELLIKYIKENIYLFKKLKKETNDVLTNERKTYYENENIERLKFFYYYIFATIYIIFLLRYIIFSFKKPSHLSFLLRGIIFIGLIVLPFVSPRILSIFIFIIYKIYSFLPKNVYLYQTSNQ